MVGIRHGNQRAVCLQTAAPMGLVTSLKGKKTDMVRISFRIRESLGEAEGLGSVNLEHDVFG